MTSTAFALPLPPPTPTASRFVCTSAVGHQWAQPPFVPSPAPSTSRTAVTRMVNTRVASTPARAPTPSANRAERWLITLCGVPAEADGVKAAVEREVRAQGGSAEGWRRLGDAAHELSVRAAAGAEHRLRRALNAISGVDAVLQAEASVRAGKALAVFDLDSTLIAEETIDELAAEAGASERVRALTRRAMAGDLAFRDALAQRVAVLRGLPVDALARVRRRATFTPGARELVSTLRATGCVTAVVSGGFHFLADHVRDHLGLDYAFANSLEVAHGRLTGRTVGPVVDAQFKADVLSDLATRHHVPPERVMAVGDGSNDLFMLQRAGLGVAFNAKPKVQHASKARVNQPSLRNILYLLGLDDLEIARLRQ